jgi:sodium transport system permease protein
MAKKLMTILKKELIDAFRDTRSLVMILLPVFVFPILFFGLDRQINTAQNDIEDSITIAITQTQNASGVIDILLNSDHINIIVCENISDALRNGLASLGIDTSGETPIIVYDQNSIRSCVALEEIETFVEVTRHNSILSEIVMLGGNPSVLDYFSLDTMELASYSNSPSNTLLISLFPMLVVMFVFNGGTAVCIDAFCGEKERGTLECLILTQASRLDILVAKTIAGLILCVASAVVSVFGCLIAIKFNPNVAALYGAADVSISYETILLVTGISLTFAFFAVAIMIFLSITSRSVKEGQLKISVLTIFPALIGGITMYIELSEATIPMFCIPILNITILLKQIFMGIISPCPIIVTMGSSLIYGGLLTMLSMIYFNSERIL